jgi:hypothetical protein
MNKQNIAMHMQQLTVATHNCFVALLQLGISVILGYDVSMNHRRTENSTTQIQKAKNSHTLLFHTDTQVSFNHLFTKWLHRY